ncbi:uncharacterized protein CDAR_408941 [Caerostris darwini]|uniref:Uncharacterized protein n=1 Tax=Caerostris darwini TaxID=1538125 RepID=A0AAV4PA46_9ARAC|nr:uncharacterized protein CDAR_408941 [Caerostris darwini]
MPSADAKRRFISSRRSPRAHSSGFLLAGLYTASFWFCMLTMFATVDCRPHNMSEPRWINPCDLPGHLFDPLSDMVGAPYVDEFEIAQGLAKKSRLARDQAKHLFTEFIDEAFADGSFLDGLSSHRLTWLPKVTRSEVRNMDLPEACPFWFRVMQYYGVGMEQVIMDEVLYGGSFLTFYREAENHLTQLLCQLQMSIYLLRVKQDPDVLRDVMNQKYRSGAMSQRMLRNYLIFRDYINALEIMVETFEGLQARTKPTTTLEQQSLY